ncbi:MAG: immunoglobulin-like domain-containing protein [Candidatus Limivicinus sp.]|jgi:hypothetical protein
MKKIFTVLMAALLLFAAAGCGSESAEPEETDLSEYNEAAVNDKVSFTLSENIIPAGTPSVTGVLENLSGEDYSYDPVQILEVMRDGQWHTVPPITEAAALNLYFLPAGSTEEYEFVFEGQYEKLPAGSYRALKKLANEKGGTAIAAAVFEITDAAPVPAETEAPEETAAAAPGLEINIYHGDEYAENIVPEATEIPELSPQALLDGLYNAGVFSQPVTVNSFSIDEAGSIQIDLSGSFGELMSGTGTTGEYITLGSLVNTFLDAYDASQLSFTVEGEILVTGHNIYDFPQEFYQ